MKRTIIIAAMLLSAQARAEFLDGNKLYEICTSRSSVDQMDCLGYITGVFDTKDTVSHCPDGRITRGQIRDIAVKFLYENPKDRHFTADVLVAAAFTKAWPCQPATKPSDARF